MEVQHSDTAWLCFAAGPVDRITNAFRSYLGLSAAASREYCRTFETPVYRQALSVLLDYLASECRLLLPTKPLLSMPWLGTIVNPPTIVLSVPSSSANDIRFRLRELNLTAHAAAIAESYCLDSMAPRIAAVADCLIACMERPDLSDAVLAWVAS